MKSKRIVSVVMVMVIIICCSFSTSVYASGLQQSKAAEEEKKKQAENEKSDLESYLTKINQKAQNLSEEAAEIQSNYIQKKQEVEEITKELALTEEASKAQYQNMRKRIKLIYEKGTSSYMEAILSSGSIAEMLNKAQYVSEVFGFDKSLLDDYNGKINKISYLKTQLENDTKELEKLHQEAQVKLAEAKASINETKEELKKYIKSIADSDAKIKELNDKIIAQGNSVGTSGGHQGNQTHQQEVIQGDGITITGEELDKIAAMVYCEAGGEGFDEMWGVASVIVNRIKSSRYPNDVESVLWQKGQFAPTWEGKYTLALAKGVPDICYEASRKAISGASNVGTSIGFKLASTGIEGIVIGKIVFFG